MFRNGKSDCHNIASPARARKRLTTCALIVGPGIFITFVSLSAKVAGCTSYAKRHQALCTDETPAVRRSDAGDIDNETISWTMATSGA